MMYRGVSISSWGGQKWWGRGFKVGQYQPAPSPPGSVHPQKALEQEAEGPQLQVGLSTGHGGQGTLDGHPA